MAITFPVGFLFRPTDKEVIQHYLLKKQIGEELPLDGVIQERDVYTEEVLSEVFRSSETRVYFFTQLKKKYLKGSNHDRTVGKATWRSESVDDICVDQKTVIGKKRVLDYINPGSVGHRDWNMKEFSLDGVLLEIPQTSSDYVVCLLEKKEPAIKRDRQKNMQSKKRARGALENLPSGNSNYKRIKLPSKQNQQVENQQTESAPLVDEQVGLINREAGVETLEQIMQYLLEPDSSMVDVDEKNVEQMMQYLLEQDSPLDSMPPLMEAKPAPTVDKDGGYPSGENEVRMQPSIPNQSLPSSNPEYAVADSIHCLASAPEITAIENDVGILEQPSIPPPESLPSDSPGHSILNSVIPSATPAPTVEPSDEYVSSDGLDGVLLKLPQIVSSCSIRISSAPIDQQVASIHGEASVESMVNVENVVATNTLAMLPPSASYDLFECTSMPPLVEGKPAATVNEEGGCTSRQQEIRMLPVEKSHLEYQPSVAAPEFLADDAVMDSIILLSTTVEGFAEDFIKDFIDYF